MRRGRVRGANLKHTREITRYYVAITLHAKELLRRAPNKVFVIMYVLITATVHIQEPASTISSKLNHLYRFSFTIQASPSNMPLQHNSSLTMYTN